MIEGRAGGSGSYSFHETHRSNYSVLTAHMPEDNFKVRVVFRYNGETNIPILVIDETQAQLLWSSLKRMADDLKWDDRMSWEIAKDLENRKEG